MSLIPVAADHPGSLAAELTTIDGREVVLVEIADKTRRGAISEADGHTFAAAIDHALHAGLPLLGILSSRGADVNDGVAALHGWGTRSEEHTSALQSLMRISYAFFCLKNHTTKTPL